MEITIRDFVYFSTVLISVSTAYWLLVVRIVKLESTKDELAKKVDALLESVDNLKTLISEHIAYHKGKESKNNE